MQLTPHGKRKTELNPQVSDLMTRPAVTVAEDLSLGTLAQLFLSQGLSRVPVVDTGGRPVGIVAKTDLIEESTEVGEVVDLGAARLRMKGGVETELPGSHVEPEVRTVADVMTRNPVTVPADAPVWLAAALLTERGLHGLPVVNVHGKVVGMISATDLVRWVSLGR